MARAVPNDFSKLRVSVQDKRPLEVSAEETHAMGVDQLRLSVADGSTLFGRVVLPDGRALPETPVKFELPESSQRWGAQWTFTDSEGRFQIHGILDDDIAVTVNGWRIGEALELVANRAKDESGTRWLGIASARASETSVERPLELVARPAMPIRGRVVASKDESLEHCHVWVGGESLVKHRTRFAERSSNLGAKRFPVDPVTGEFEVHGYEMGDVGVFAQLGRGKHAQSSQLVTFHAVKVPGRLELRLDPVAAFTGLVVDAAGQPIQRGRVKVSKESRWSLTPWREAEVDHEGRFRLEALPPGEYVATIEHDKYLLPEPVTFVVEEGADSPPSMTLQAAVGGHVLVHWELGGGALIEDYGLPYVTDAGGESISNAQRSRRNLRGGSSYLLGPLPPGKGLACLRFRYGVPDGPRVLMRQAVTIEAQQTTHVHLRSGELVRRTVDGRVMGEDGAALVGYRVSIERDGRSVSSCGTDEDGRFTLPFQAAIRGADALSAKLTARDPQWTIAQAAIPNLEAGSTDVEWTLPTGSVHGQIGTGEESPELWARMMLEVVPLGADPAVRVPGRSVRVLGKSFEIPHLAPGSYTLVGWRYAPGEGGRGDFYTRSEMATKPLVVSVRDGEVTRGIQLMVCGR